MVVHRNRLDDAFSSHGKHPKMILSLPGWLFIRHNVNTDILDNEVFVRHDDRVLKVEKSAALIYV